MTPRDDELIRLQLAALYLTDERGRIASTNEPDGTPAPRLFLARGRDAVVWALGATVGDELAEKLSGLLPDEPPMTDLDHEQRPRHEAVYRRLLDAQDTEAWSGPAFWLPPVETSGDAVLLGPDDIGVLAGEFDYVHDEYAALAPVAAVVVDGRAVAACRCSRRTDAAAEAGVDTVDGYGGRGYATATVAAWAEAVRAGGRLPLYSTSWTNVASRRIAARLGAVSYAADWSLD